MAAQITIRHLSPIVMRNERLLFDRATTEFAKHNEGCFTCTYRGAPNSHCRSQLIITKKDYYDCLVTCTLREGEEIFKPKQEPLRELTTLEKMNKLMRDLHDRE